MICVMLAAGYATRLYPLTLDCPKALLKVGGKTILDRVLENVDRGCDPDRCVLISNDKFFGAFSDWSASSRYSVPVEILNDGTDCNANRRGAVADLLFAMDQMGLDDDLFVMAVDYFVDFELRLFLDYSREHSASCILRYRESDLNVLRKSGVMSVDGNDRILRMEEKPDVPFDVWCSPPFYYYAKSDLPLIRNSIMKGCSNDAPGSLAAWLSRQTDVYAMEMPGAHYDIGDLESYMSIRKRFET